MNKLTRYLPISSIFIVLAITFYYVLELHYESEDKYFKSVLSQLKVGLSPELVSRIVDTKFEPLTSLPDQKESYYWGDKLVESQTLLIWYFSSECQFVGGFTDSNKQTLLLQSAYIYCQ